MPPDMSHVLHDRNFKDMSSHSLKKTLNWLIAYAVATSALVLC